MFTLRNYQYFIISLCFLCGCISARYVKPGLKITNDKVGLAFVNYSVHPNFRNEIIKEQEELLISYFKMMIAANTVYKFYEIPESIITANVSKYFDTLTSNQLMENTDFRNQILLSARAENLKYVIMIFLNNFEKNISDKESRVNLFIQFMDVETEEIVYYDIFHDYFNKDFVFKIVSAFPGAFTTNSATSPENDIYLIDPKSITKIDNELISNAAAVALINEACVKVEIKPGDLFSSFTEFGNIYTTQTYHRAIKILNESGYQYADVEIPFSADSYITELEARTITKDGRIIHIPPEDIHEVSLFPDYVFFSDIKAYRFTFPAIEPGCVVEYKYKYTVESVSLWGSWSFQESIPVIKSKFAMEYPGGLEYREYFSGKESLPDNLRKTVSNFDEWEKRSGYFNSIFDASPRLIRTYELKNIPSLKSEKSMPDFNEIVPKLKYCSATFNTRTFLTDWSDISNWYRNLISEKFEPDETVSDLAKNLTRGLQTDKEKIKVLYDYVRNNTRYVAKNIGMGSIVPASPQDVYSKKYGDCKGFSALLICMLSEIGIEAYPVLLNTQTDYLDENYVALSQFNHMIVVALNRGVKYWMDATARYCPFDNLPYGDLDKKVLVIKDESEFMETPPLDSKQNVTDFNLTVFPAKNNDVFIKGKIILTGQPALIYRSVLLNKNEYDQNKWLIEHIKYYFQGSDDIYCELKNLEIVKDPLEINFENKVSDIFSNVNSIMIFKPLNIRTKNIEPLSTGRQFPYLNIYPEIINEKINIIVPSNYFVEDLPETKTFQSDFGVYSIFYKQWGDTLKIERNLSKTLKRIPTYQIEEYNKFSSLVEEFDKKQLILTKN